MRIRPVGALCGIAAFLGAPSLAAAPLEPAGTAYDHVHSILSVHLAATPLWMTGPAGSEYNTLSRPLMIGGRADYLYRFGIFRAGGGISYASVFSRADDLYLFRHEFRILPLVSAAYTFDHGTEIAATGGVGLAISSARAFNPEFEPYDPDYAWHGPLYNPCAELMLSVAVPIAHVIDVSFRTGVAATAYSKAHFELPFELGVRKRW